MAKRRPDLLTEPPREFKRLVEAAGASRVELIEPGDDAVVAPRDEQ